MMQPEFESILQHHNIPGATAQKLWREVETSYAQAGRHYHTMEHLETLLHGLAQQRILFSNWHSVVLAIAYHDIVYNVLKNNNEEKSAQLAVARLSDIGLPISTIRQCEIFILATQKHQPADEETNLFTDADLSILGSAPAEYDIYRQQIRNEYSIFPDIVYKPGRRKVLEHFLTMNNIYKTEVFRAKFEIQARQNLLRELTDLD